MTFETGLIFFISLVLMWIKPGPAQLLKIATALNKGFLPAICISLGSILMCSIFFIVAALGYQTLSIVFKYTGFILQILGAGYLIFLSIKGFKKIRIGEKPKQPLNIILNKKIKKQSRLIAYFWVGIGITLSNPFWIFYFIGILPALIPLETIEISSFYSGALLVFISGILVDGPLLLLVTQLQKAFEGEKITKIINIFINFSFLAIALFLLYSAFSSYEFSFDIHDVL